MRASGEMFEYQLASDFGARLVRIPRDPCELVYSVIRRLVVGHDCPRMKGSKKATLGHVHHPPWNKINIIGLSIRSEAKWTCRAL